MPLQAAVRIPLEELETIQYCTEDVECLLNGDTRLIVQAPGHGLEEEEELEGSLLHVFYAGQRRSHNLQKRLYQVTSRSHPLEVRAQQENHFPRTVCFPGSMGNHH